MLDISLVLIYNNINTNDKKRGETRLNIKNIREQAGLTQAEVAKALNVGQSAVAAWEADKALPRADKLINIAKLLNCSIEELLENEVTNG